MRWAFSAISAATLLGSVGAGCASSDVNQTSAPVVLAMTDQTAATYSDQELTIYEVQVAVPLPVRKPTGIELNALNGAVDPYPRHPYLLNTDENIEVHYTISNMDDQRHAVYFLLDPWNEFVRYFPGVTQVNNEQTVPNASGVQRAVLIDGRSRVQGTVTSDDANEMAIDLATAMEIMVQYNATAASGTSTGMNAYGTIDAATLINHAFDPQNRSNAQPPDPLLNPPGKASYIPKVIAGLTGFDLGLRTDTAENVAVEIQIDITDLNGNRFIPQGQKGETIGLPPVVLRPPGAK